MTRESKEMKFEAALGKLEDIVKKLEEGDLPLDDSLKMFEEGVRLARFCGTKLDAAERKIEILMKTEGGAAEPIPFDEPGEAPAAGREEPPSR